MAPVGFSNRPNIGTFPDLSDYFQKHCEMENSSMSGNRGGMEMEDVWSDLHALKKLYGLLQRTNGVMIPQGECQEIILDEKSRHLLKKLLDGATQEAIQCQSKILSKSSTELTNPSEKTQEETKCNPSSLEVPEEKVQQGEKPKPETEPNPCHPVCKRAELKHQKSDKTMKTGLDLKPLKRSEHPLPDLHRRILQDRHRPRSEVSSSGDPNQPRPSGPLLVRNPSRLGRSSKRSRVDAPGRARVLPRPVDESTRYRRAEDTNSVSSHVIKPPAPSTRPSKLNQTAEISHHLRKKEVGPTESKPSHTKERNKLISGASRPSPRQLRSEMRVKPIRYTSITSSNSTATGSPSSSTGPESRTSDETLSRRRVPRRSPHLIARSSVPILVHGEKSPPGRMLSQHKVGPRRRGTSKREQEKGRGRLKRLKDKLALIFHHHHHHHHYHHHRPGHVDGGGEVVQGNNHASPWRYLRRVMGHRNGKEEKGKMAPGQQRLGLLHVLLDALLRHVWGTPQRRAAQAKWTRLGNAGKKPRWWQVFKRRGGLKLANQNKPRRKLGFSRAHSGVKRKT